MKSHFNSSPTDDLGNWLSKWNGSVVWHSCIFASSSWTSAVCNWLSMACSWQANVLLCHHGPRGNCLLWNILPEQVNILIFMSLFVCLFVFCRLLYSKRVELNTCKYWKLCSSIFNIRHFSLYVTCLIARLLKKIYIIENLAQKNVTRIFKQICSDMFVDSFPRGWLEENCELWGTDYVQVQISEHIFAPNRDYCVFYPSKKFFATHAVLKITKYRSDIPQFLLGNI